MKSTLVTPLRDEMRQRGANVIASEQLQAGSINYLASRHAGTVGVWIVWICANSEIGPHALAKADWQFHNFAIFRIDELLGGCRKAESGSSCSATGCTEKPAHSSTGSTLVLPAPVDRQLAW